MFRKISMKISRSYIIINKIQYFDIDATLLLVLQKEASITIAFSSHFCALLMCKISILQICTCNNSALNIINFSFFYFSILGATHIKKLGGTPQWYTY